jgi:hypothetical protein
MFQGSSNSAAESAAEVPCGVAKVRLASSVSGDLSIAKRLTMLLLSCMRAAGTLKVYVEVPRFDVKVPILRNSVSPEKLSDT